MAGNIGGYVAPGPSTAPVTGVVASGAVQAGALGSGSVVSGNIASGQIGRFHIGSGMLAGFELGSGSIVSGRIASGQIGINHLASGTTVSASGTVQQFQLGSGAVNSGHVSSGSILGQAGGGAFTIASGTVTTNDLGSGCIVSGLIASGQIGLNHLASGSVGTYSLSSGVVARAANFLSPFQSGTGWSLITEETISGVRAVCVSQSGNLRIAMGAISGRMPAIGIVVDNVLSGIPANVYQGGAFQVTSGMADYSGYLGKPAWVGRSGQIVSFSGSFQSGGFLATSGQDFVQRMGVIFNSGGFVVCPDNTVMQNQLIGVSDLVDVINRGYGV